MKFNQVEDIVTDNKGNQLSPIQVSFFAESSIRDSGRLMVCYHGDKRHGKESFRFPMDAPPCTFFSADREYASGFGDNIYRCYLNMKHPFGMITPAMQRKFLTEVVAYGEELNDNPSYSKMITTGFTAKDVPLGGLISYQAADLLYVYMKHFDTIWDGILAQEKPDGVNLNYGLGSISYIPLEQNQIKSIENRNPTNSSNINESLSLVESELTPEQDKYFRLSKIRNQSGELTKCYAKNINPDNIDQINWLSTDSEYGNLEVYLNCLMPFVVNNVDNNMFVINSDNIKLSKEFKIILNKLDISERLFVSLLRKELIKPGVYKYSIKDILEINEFNNLIRRAGFDCVKIVEKDYDLYGVFNNGVIKFVSNENPTNNLDPAR